MTNHCETCLLHESDDLFFKNCCKENKQDFLKYLIIEYGINKTEEIDDYLNKTKNNSVIYAKKLFLEGKLNQYVKINNNNEVKNKI